MSMQPSTPRKRRLLPLARPRQQSARSCCTASRTGLKKTSKRLPLRRPGKTARPSARPWPPISRWPLTTSATSRAPSAHRRAASPRSAKTPWPTTTTSHSAWSARSSRGTSRCSWPPGRLHRPWPPVTASCSSLRSKRQHPSSCSWISSATSSQTACSISSTAWARKLEPHCRDRIASRRSRSPAPPRWASSSIRPPRTRSSRSPWNSAANRRPSSSKTSWMKMTPT